NCGFKLEEGPTTRVVFKGPVTREPIKLEVELPETKVGRAGRAAPMRGTAGVKPGLPDRPLGACAETGAIMPDAEMRARINAPLRLPVMCIILLLRRIVQAATLPMRG